VGATHDSYENTPAMYTVNVPLKRKILGSCQAVCPRTTSPESLHNRLNQRVLFFAVSSECQAGSAAMNP
jgi:hypothetical protein